MFTHYKIIVVLLLALALSACTTHAIRPTLITAEPTASSAVVPERITVSTALLIDPVQLPIMSRDTQTRLAVTPREIECMAQAIYHEAKSEGYSGKVAVGYVILNRIADGRFRSTVCDTVYQKDKGRCQFSWCKSNPAIRHETLYAEAREIAE
jgi:hypothetical protein